MSINECSVDILLCITERLCLKDLLALSSSSHSLYYLRDIDCIWKRLCRYDYGLFYNHPDQSYKTLYQNTHQRAFAGRRPCHHLSSYSYEYDLTHIPFRSLFGQQKLTDLRQSTLEDPIYADSPTPQKTVCSYCSIVGVENLFLCVHPDCFKIVCDRHSRLHARQCYDPSHSVFIKINTAELFCQACVDWVGGVNSDPAEQYQVRKLLERWLPQVYPAMTTVVDQQQQQQQQQQHDIITLRQKRRYERYLRWQDSPHQIMMEPYGVCFLPSRWIAQWEMFVEGWHTIPPDMPIDHDQWRYLMSDSTNVSINFSPSSSSSGDLVVVSHKTWSYLLSKYTVVGSPITEDDLRRWKLDMKWQQRLDSWKSRLLV